VLKCLHSFQSLQAIPDEMCHLWVGVRKPKKSYQVPTKTTPTLGCLCLGPRSFGLMRTLRLLGMIGTRRCAHSVGFSRAGSVPGVGVDLAAALVRGRACLRVRERVTYRATAYYCGCPARPRRTCCTAFARADLGSTVEPSACSLVFWACRIDVLLHGMGRFARGVQKKNHRTHS
jgi:hypothetical protein